MNYFPPRYLFRRYEILRHVRAGQTFLEIGPGNLYMAVELLAHFECGTLVEFNPSIEEYFRALPIEYRNRLRFMIGDFLIDEVPGQHDCVVACEVLEHVEDHHRFLRKIRSLLAPGGQLILSVPAHMKMWSIHDHIVGHIRRYERKDLEALVQSEGFVNIKVISYGFPFTRLLRWPRITYGWLASYKRRSWDNKKQTQQSGLVGQNSKALSYIGFAVNPKTTYLLSRLASLFNGHDLSDGYILVADVERD